jgi:branched-chain amino acid transport system substrate-binding protein
MSGIKRFKPNRRQVLQGIGASAVALTVGRPAFAVPQTIKIGLVQPQTGPLAFFSEQMPFVLGQIKKATGGSIKINGTNHPYEVIIKDSQSNPNRAAEVAQDLILNDKVNLVTAYATPETVNPVADQCELNAVPCVSNDAPLEPYFFGRKGDPKKGFEWTYHFFFNADNLSDTYVAFWKRISTDKVAGGLWPNDSDGVPFSHLFTAKLTAAGYKTVDPGRFDLPSGNYNTQIAAFKSAGVEIACGVLPPPEFTAFWQAAAQQGFRPKAVSIAKATEFAPTVIPLGDRGQGLSVEVWWSPFHPYSSGLTGMSSKELGDSYEAAANKQWSMSLGFRHSLFEVAFDALKRTQTLDKAESIRDAVRDTNYKSIVGPINFKTGPLPNTSRTPLVIGQWLKGKKFPLELTIVDNTTAPDVPTAAAPVPVIY